MTSNPILLLKATDRLLRGEAWDAFCDQLKAAGRIVESFAEEASDQDRAEWYRFLTRLTRNGLERFVENCEPESPRLRDAPWRQSINVQNPDQDHQERRQQNAGDHLFHKLVLWQNGKD